MRIKTKFGLSIAASVLASVVVAMLVYNILAEMRHGLIRNEGYVEIINKTSALNVLLGSQVERPTRRVVHQVRNVVQSLGQAMEAITPLDVREGFLLSQIRENYGELSPVLDRLHAEGWSVGTLPGIERRRMLRSVLRVKARAITDDIVRLQELNQDRLLAAQARAVALVLGLIGILILLNAVISYLGSSSIVQAVLALSAGVQRIQGGDLRHRVAVRGTDELGELAQGFNEMTTSLSASYESLNSHARLLERSNRELQEFAFVASHDLQEPLRKIQAFSSRVGREPDDVLGAQSRDFLARVRNAAERMQNLINDLLAFSRVSSRHEPFRSVDLNLLVREVQGDLETLVTQAEGKVEVGKLPTIEADPVQMRQLFQNLIGNGLKYHTPGRPPRVALAGECREGENGRTMCEITVQDNGIGFDEKYLGKIFMPFQRLHGRREYEGTGIGLAICRRIVERHGGSITARSSPGEGSTFVVTLPATQADNPDRSSSGGLPGDSGSPPQTGPDNKEE